MGYEAVFQWIETFLTDRLQAVIDQAIQLLASKSLTFADDTKLLKAIMLMLCCALLQEDLDRVVEWSIANNMLLLEDKIEVISYCLSPEHHSE